MADLGYNQRRGSVSDDNLTKLNVDHLVFKNSLCHLCSLQLHSIAGNDFLVKEYLTAVFENLFDRIQYKSIDFCSRTLQTQIRIQGHRIQSRISLYNVILDTFFSSIFKLLKCYKYSSLFSILF
ncbi:Uncharacterised protein r2_g1771 [Pycnogonum litorale]